MIQPECIPASGGDQAHGGASRVHQNMFRTEIFIVARTKKVGDLQINEDMEFQERTWVIQRIGWVIFALVSLLALLGLFGDGVLSEAQAGQQGGALWLEYPRFERLEDEFLIKVHANEGVASEGEIIVQLNKNYLETVEVNNISPAPDSQLADGDQITYVFKTNDGSSPFTAYFYLMPRKPGPLSGAFKLQNGNPVRFSQFIYP